jgi:hypothetical protein
LSGKQSHTIEVSGFLFEGTHDALIELRSNIGVRNANRMIAHMSEALIEDYPLRLSDMQFNPKGSEQKAIPIKIVLSRKSAPRLVACYESLAWGVRGMALINLMNRLYMLGEADPSKVEEILRRRAAVRSGADGRMPDGGAESASAVRVESRPGHVFAGRPEVSSDMIEEEIVLTSLPVESDDSEQVNMLMSEDDPLIGINVGGF